MPLLRFHTAGVRVHLLCPDSATADLVADVGTPMLARDTAPADVTVTCPALGDSVERAAARALSLVDRAALAHTPCLTVHAAALAGPAGCVVLPGVSGAGKSTLAGAAMQAGLLLLSDEAACFSNPFGTLLPHPRPLGLSLMSRQLLGLDGPDGDDDEQATAPSLLGAGAKSGFRGRCSMVVLPDRQAGIEASLRSLTAAEALPALLANCLNVPSLTAGQGWQPDDAWRYLSILVRRVRLARLTFDSPHEGARLLVEALTC